MTQRGCCSVSSDYGEAVGADLVVPARPVVVALLLVVAGEQAVLEVEALLARSGGVGEGLHVLVLDLVVVQQVVHHAAQERDVGALPDRRSRDRRPTPCA